MSDAEPILPSAIPPPGKKPMSATAIARRNTAHGSVRVFIAEALMFPSGFAVTVFLSRTLSKSEFGLFGLVISLITTIEWAVSTMFSRWTIKTISEADDWRPLATTFIRAYLIAGLVVTAVLIGSSQLIATHLLEAPGATQYLILAALDVPLFLLSQGYRAVLVGLGRYTPRALAGAGRYIARPIMVVTLVYLGMSISGALIASIIASIVELALCAWKVHIPLRGGAGRQMLPKLLSYAGPMFVAAGSMQLFNKVDLFALNKLWNAPGPSTFAAAFYRLAQDLSMIPVVFGAAISPLLLSSVGRAIKGGDTLLAGRLTTDALRVMIGTVPFAAIVAGAALPLVRVVSGDEYAPAAPILLRLAFAATAMVVFQVCIAVLTAGAKLRWSLLLCLPMPILAILAHLYVIPRSGAAGAAEVTLVVSIIGVLAAVATVYHFTRALPPLGTLIRSTLLSVAVFFIGRHWIADTRGVLVLVKMAVLGTGVVAAYAGMGEISRKEAKFARDTLLNPIKRLLGIRKPATSADTGVELNH